MSCLARKMLTSAIALARIVSFLVLSASPQQQAGTDVGDNLWKSWQRNAGTMAQWNRSLRFEQFESKLLLSTNQAPVVDAGPDLELSANDVAALVGTVADDGPLAAVNTGWVKVRGPGQVTFEDPSAVQTTAEFSAPGIYDVRLEANDGELTAIDYLTINVTATSQAPLVDAGVDQTVLLATEVLLDGTVTDDGSPSDLTTTWVSVSGPSLVTFADPAAEDTSVSFTVPGTYVLQLEANNGETSGSDLVTINVEAPNEAPQVDAGASQTVLITNGVALDGTVTDDSLPSSPGTVATTWNKLSGPGDVTFEDSGAVDTTATFSEAGTYVLSLEAHDGELMANDEVTITVESPAPSSVVYRAPSELVFSGGPGEHVEVEHSQPLELAEGTVALTFTADNVSGRHALFSKDARGNGDGGHLTAFVTNGLVEVRLQSATDEIWLQTAAGSIAAGEQYDLAVTFGSAGFRVYLNGQLVASQSEFTQGLKGNTENLAIGANTWARDDSNPAGTWDPFDGRIKGFTIYNAQLDATEVAALGQSKNENPDPVGNTAPIVDAGPEGSVLISAAFSLHGTVTDDGLPGSLETTWSKVSGPGEVTFSDVSARDITASFTQVGTYELRLEAHDGELSSSDSVLITVADNQQTVSGFFISPNGSSTGDGSADNPWDLQTALSHPGAVKPGDTLWLLGGTYRGGFVSTLTGTADHPIIVRAYPGEHVVIDIRDSSNAPRFVIDGSHTHFIGLEITSTDSKPRVSSQPGSSSSETDRGGISIVGSHIKLINAVVHDLREGPGFWSSGEGGEIYGSIIYNNGWVGPDRAHGHGIYTQNHEGTKLIVDNIIFNQFKNGIQAYGSGDIKGYYIEGNVVFNNNGIDIIVGTQKTVQDVVVTENYTYEDDGSGSIWLGYQWGLENKKLTVSENYFATPVRFYQTWDPISAHDNIVALGDVTGTYPADGFSIIKSPHGVNVFVRPNQYEDGRANIVVYNWDKKPSVDVDLSSVLTVGTSYEVHHVYELYGAPVAAGVYDGSAVKVPMVNTSAPQLFGGGFGPGPQSVGPEFGAFVVTSVPAQSQPLLATDDAIDSGKNSETLNANQLAGIVDAALAEWETHGLTSAEHAALARVQFQIADLDGRRLGEVSGTTITIDDNAAGHGWFVDETPQDNDEYQLTIARELVALTDSPAENQIDLLTVVMHELGHLFGLDHSGAEGDSHDIMAQTLRLGVRRVLDNVIGGHFRIGH